jgi:hypothetical protein
MGRCAGGAHHATRSAAASIWAVHPLCVCLCRGSLPCAAGGCAKHSASAEVQVQVCVYVCAFVPGHMPHAYLRIGR